MRGTPARPGGGQVDYLYLVDDVGNGAYFTAAALAARGLAVHVLLSPPFNGTVLEDAAAAYAGAGAGADAEGGGPADDAGAVYI